MRSADTAPFGLGLEPLPSRLGRLRDRALHALIYRTLSARSTASTDAMRQSWTWKLPRAACSTRRFPVPVPAADRPVVRYPRSDLAAQVPSSDRCSRPHRPLALPGGGTSCTPIRGRCARDPGHGRHRPARSAAPGAEALRGRAGARDRLTAAGSRRSAGPPRTPAWSGSCRSRALMPHVAAVGHQRRLWRPPLRALARGAAGRWPATARRSPTRGARNGAGSRGMRTRSRAPGDLREAVRRVLGEPDHAARAAAMI